MFKRIYNKVWYYIRKPKFKSFGFGSVIQSPLKIQGAKNIVIGKSVIVSYKTWLAAVPLTGLADCILEIGDGTIIGNFNHIYATGKVTLGKKVLTADKVYISDNLHGYEQIDLPIMDQPVKQNKWVSIGDGTWVGENVCIMGAIIGKNCVIGANAVVTKDIPDYSIAVGNPAIIIKRYCLESRMWKRTSPDGKFI